MLNEEKIKLMTRAALDEKKMGREELFIHRFYKRDYILYHLLMILCCVTVAFIIGIVAVVLWLIENNLDYIQNIDIPLAVFCVSSVYLCTIFFYLVLGFFLYRYRYDRAERRGRKYQEKLKAIDRFYIRENRILEGRGNGEERQEPHS